MTFYGKRRSRKKTFFTRRLFYKCKNGLFVFSFYGRFHVRMLKKKISSSNNICINSIGKNKLHLYVHPCFELILCVISKTESLRRRRI